MPAPSLDTRRRRAAYAKTQKLNSLVSGNNSLRIAVRSLDNKSQQMLSDRLHFINKLGKGYISTAFKGLNQHGGVQSKTQCNTPAPEGVEDDYGVHTFVGVDVEAMMGVGKRGRAKSSKHRRRRKGGGYNRIDDLKRIAALTRAADQAIPGATGHIYRPPKKCIQFARATHDEPFQSQVLLNESGSHREAGPTNLTYRQRPNTAPLGLRAVKRALPRRTHSRQRPSTMGSARPPLLLSANWEGLFAKQSRPGTADTAAGDGGGSRPGSSGCVAKRSRPGTADIPAAAAAAGGGNRPESLTKQSRHTSISRPGTSEYLLRARARRERRRRPATVEQKRASRARRSRKRENRPRTATATAKNWTHKHRVTARNDQEDDYKAMVQRLVDTRIECDLVSTS